MVPEDVKNEHETRPRHNTARSWRAMRLVICFIASIGFAIGAFGAYFADRKDSSVNAQEELAQIKINQANEAKAADRLMRQKRGDKVDADGYPFDEEAFIPPAGDFAATSVLSPSEQQQRVASLQKTVGLSTTTIIFQALGLGLLAGVGGWIGAWLLIVAIAFVWWFILDRIREFVRAARGQP
jgi:hypothetical protein